jgi:hypothetical protein
MISLIDKVRDEDNCGRATDRGEEVCECAVKLTHFSVVNHILVQAARLRTETSYKAGSERRVSPSSRSRSRNSVQVNGELAQRNITFLSGEICTDGLRAVVAPASKACLNAWNGLVQASPGGAEVSRGRTTEDRMPTITGRTKRGRRRSHRSARCEGTPLRLKRPPVRCPDRDVPQRRRLSSQP